MVDAQVRKWEAQERAARKAAVVRRPVITVSRSFGSQGAALGKRIAERLEFEFWDQAIVHAIADHAHMPARLFASLDEHRQGAVRTLIDTLSFGESVTEGDYLHQLQHVIHTISAHGSAVIVGRGAHYVLPADEALRVRIDAPLEDRVVSVARRHHVSEAEARRMIRVEDEARGEFMRFHYDRTLDVTTDFDLVLNSATLAPEPSVEVVLAAYRARFPSA